MSLYARNQNAECLEIKKHLEEEIIAQGISCTRIMEREIALGTKFKPTPKFMARLEEYRNLRDQMGRPYGFKHPDITAFFDGFLTIFVDAIFILAVRNPLRAAMTRQYRGHVLSIKDGVCNYCTRLNHALSQPVSWYTWNYDGDQEVESEKLSALLGVTVDTTKGWTDARTTHLQQRS